jgi:ATP-dependent Clp protease ATP-binding subunit ClpA
MFERFTSDARQVVFAAIAKVTARDDKEVRPGHLLIGLITTEGVAGRVLADLGVTESSAESIALGPAGAPAPGDAEVLKAIGIDLDEIKRKAEQNFGTGALDRHLLTRRGPFGWISDRTRLTGESKFTLQLSLREARALHHNYLGTEHLLLGLLRAGQANKHGDFTPLTLHALGIDPDAARQRVLDALGQAA